MTNQVNATLLQSIPGRIYLQRILEILYNVVVFTFVVGKRKWKQKTDNSGKSTCIEPVTTTIHRGCSQCFGLFVNNGLIKSIRTKFTLDKYKYKNDLDPNYTFHAYNNPKENALSCCVEPYIEKGYIFSNMTFRYYLKVLWMPNNEMLNVWTHLIPAIYFTYMLYDFNKTVDLVRAWPLLLITTTAIMLTGMSALAHMFHSRSCFHHQWWFLIDYFGIIMFAFGSTMSHFYASAEVFYYKRIGWYNTIVFTLLCMGGYFCCVISRFGNGVKCIKTARTLKLASNAIGYFYGMIPLVFRFSLLDDPAIFYHKLQFVFMILAPIWYASDIPQKFWPGKFDIIGHSHQVFHIFGALACYFDIKAVYIDITHPDGHWMALSIQDDYPTLQGVFLCVGLLTLFCLQLLKYLSKYIPSVEACQKSRSCICASDCSFSFLELIQEARHRKST